MSNALQIRPASAEAMLALVAITGPAGAGKTLGALLLAHGIGGKIAVLDSEVRTDRRGVLRGRSETYLGLCDASTGGTPLKFDVLPLEPPYSVERYMEALDLLWKNGYDVVIVDSLSHEWFGLLEEVDRAGGQFQSGWKSASPKHEKFIDKIMRAPSHLICTMRSKMAYEMVENSKGKREPKKIGLQPIQRDGVDYQFEVIFDIQQDHSVNLSKANANYGKVLHEEVARTPRLTSDLGQKLKKWLDGPQAVANESLKTFVTNLGTTPDKLPESLQPDEDLLAVNFADAKPEAKPVEAEKNSEPEVKLPGSFATTDDEYVMSGVVPVGLAKRIALLPKPDDILSKEDANDFNVYLMDFLGGGNDGKSKAKDAWSKVGVVVKKGAQVTRNQAIGVARLVSNK